MKLLRLITALALALVAVSAEASLAAVRRAQELVGDSWSQVVRIDNTARRSAYPREVHALVFETGGILWIYTPHDGTQSLSLHRNRLAQEKADLSPLLAAIDAGFTRWENVPADPLAAAYPADKDLPNACLLESIAAARAQARDGAQLLRAELLLVYFQRDSGQGFGHTVLAFETPSGVYVIDSDGSRRPQAVSPAWPAEPLHLAKAAFATDKRTIKLARTFPLEHFTMGYAARQATAQGTQYAGEAITTASASRTAAIN